MIRVYPSKKSIRLVVKNKITTQDTIDYFKKRGILVIAFTRDDYADRAALPYLCEKDYQELQNIMENKEVSKKAGRITIPKEQFKSFEQGLISLSRKKIESDDETKVKFIREDGKIKIDVYYEDIKPGNNELMASISKKLELVISNEKGGDYSLDYTTTSSSEKSKIKSILELIREEVPKESINFQEIYIEDLSFKERLEFFYNFFNYKFDSWQLDEIVKLKINRDKNIEELSNNDLKYITSILFSGDKLSKNSYIESMTEKGFYFSMAKMRMNHKDKPIYLEVIIDFKTRSKNCDISIVEYGNYEENEGKVNRIKKTIDNLEREKLLFMFQNIANKIFKELSEHEEDTSKSIDKVEALEIEDYEDEPDNNDDL